MFNMNKQKTKSIENIIIGYLIGHNYGDVINDMRKNLGVENDNSVFDIALSNLEDAKIITIWKRKLNGEVWVSLSEDINSEIGEK